MFWSGSACVPSLASKAPARAPAARAAPGCGRRRLRRRAGPRRPGRRPRSAASPSRRLDAVHARSRSGARRRGLLDLAPARDVALVLVVGLREGVAAGAVGDEIEVLGARRIGDRLERGAAGIGDRPRRQALDRRRCCRASPCRSRLRMMPRPSVPLPPTRPYTIVGSDCSFMRFMSRLMNTPATRGALVGAAGLLLDDRGEDDELLRRLDRQVRRAALPDLAQTLRAAPPACALTICWRVIAALELVGVGQQRALARRLGDVAGRGCRSRADARTICSLVRPSGMVTEWRIALPSTSVSIAVSMLAAGLELELARLQSGRAAG